MSGDNNDNIKNILNDYFDLIDSYFASIKPHLKEGKYAHEDLGKEFASYPLISDLVLDATEGIGDDIYKFWSTNHAKVADYLEKSDGLKCLYSGDLSPVDIEGFVKKSGLYVDTIIVPDPLMNIATFMQPAFSDKKLYLEKLIRHVFNILKLKELILADTKEKIVLLFPTNIQTLSKDIQDKIFADAESRYLDYFSQLFNLKFGSRGEVIEFLKSYATTNELFKGIKDRSRLPILVNTPDSFDSKMGEMFSLNKKFNVPRYKNISEAFGVYVFTQFLRVQEHKYYCRELVAEPIYDYELPWSFLNFDLGGQDIDPAILNALQEKEFDWIGDVPFEALKILREDGQMEYMRSTLRAGISSMRVKTDKNMSSTIKQIQENIREAFKKQKSETKQLQKQVNDILKKEIPIEAAAFLVGFIPMYGNFLTLPAVGKSIYDKYQKQSDSKKELGKQESNAVNLLLKSYEKR